MSALFYRICLLNNKIVFVQSMILLLCLSFFLLVTGRLFFSEKKKWFYWFATCSNIYKNSEILNLISSPNTEKHVGRTGDNILVTKQWIIRTTKTTISLLQRLHIEVIPGCPCLKEIQEILLTHYEEFYLRKVCDFKFIFFLYMKTFLTSGLWLRPRRKFIYHRSLVFYHFRSFHCLTLQIACETYYWKTYDLMAKIHYAVYSTENEKPCGRSDNNNNLYSLTLYTNITLWLSLKVK